MMASRRWIYLLALLPALTELIETGSLPDSPRAVVTELILTAVVLALVWRLRREYDNTVRLAETDPLTGLLNRRTFHHDLGREVARAHRMSTSLVLAYIDVDRFKSVNDRFGHATGDHVLERIGTLLVEAIRRDVDRCYRIGGDEFAVLLPASDSDGGEAARERLACLRRDCLAEFLERYGVGLSVGIAALQPGEAPEDLLARTDELLYAKKEQTHTNTRRAGLKAVSDLSGNTSVGVDKTLVSLGINVAPGK